MAYRTELSAEGTILTQRMAWITVLSINNKNNNKHIIDAICWLKNGKMHLFLPKKGKMQKMHFTFLCIFLILWRELRFDFCVFKCTITN